MKKYIPKNKAEFTDMLMREYGYSQRLSQDLSAIAAGHGAFPDEGKTPIERLMIAAMKVVYYDFGDCDDDVVEAVEDLRNSLDEAQRTNYLVEKAE